MTMTYRVVVRRDPEDARFWLADVEGLPGAHTSSRSLATLDRYVREVIVLAADLPDEAEADLVLIWNYQTGDTEVDQEADHLRRMRAEVDAASRELAEKTAQLARRLVTDGRYSVREAATLLAISPARIDQMVQKPKTTQGRRREAA